MICVWNDHLGLRLTLIGLLFTTLSTKKHFHIFVPSDLDLQPLEFFQICSPSYSCPVLCFHCIRSFYGSPISSKSEAWDRRTECIT